MGSQIADLERMRGEFDAARRLFDRSREQALELGQRLVAGGITLYQARIELAQVLTAVGRRSEAAEALDAAAVLYAQKGHIVGAARAASLRSELDALPT